MNLTYPEIFAARGDLYHAAMMAWPHARDAEFDALFARRPLAAGERVLDFPSGGGYLAKHLEGKARVVGYELTDGFAAGIPVGLPSREADPEPYDRAVCLAALHHIDDQPGFLRELATRVKPGGLLHVGDVPAGSPLGGFLDGFVGRYNQTGHQGLYLSPDPADYAALGKVLHCAEVATPWRFPDEAAMLGFCAQLFGLSGHDPRELLAALREQVGVDTGPDGVSLRWRLLYVDILVNGTR